jgi:peptidoglycan hydrolase CwlO-like protein
MKKKRIVLVLLLLLGSGCSPSSVVSSDLMPIDDAIEKDAILYSFDSKPDKKAHKVQTIKTVDEQIEKLDDLLSTVESDDKEQQNRNNSVPLSHKNKDDAIEHHLLLQD